MVKPTASEYRLDTRIPWASFGLPDPDPDPDTVLQEEIDDAWAYVESKTCRDLDVLDVTSNLGRLARRAVKLRAIQQSVQGQSSFISSSLNTLIQSFAVPGYSETRFRPDSQTSTKFQHSMINDWPVLADLLWEIMTEACRDKLLALFTEENPPFSQIVGYDWGIPSDDRFIWSSRPNDPY